MDGQVMNWCSIGLGLLVVLLGIPMIMGRVRPNRVYGFRTRKTLSSPEVWYPANRAAGRAMAVAGLLLIAATVCLMLLWEDAPRDTYALVHLALWVLALGGMTAGSFAALGRITGEDEG